jgi:hypothetical protein
VKETRAMTQAQSTQATSQLGTNKCSRSTLGQVNTESLRLRKSAQKTSAHAGMFVCSEPLEPAGLLACTQACSHAWQSGGINHAVGSSATKHTATPYTTSDKQTAYTLSRSLKPGQSAQRRHIQTPSVPHTQLLQAPPMDSAGKHAPGVPPAHSCLLCTLQQSANTSWT